MATNYDKVSFDSPNDTPRAAFTTINNNWDTIASDLDLLDSRLTSIEGNLPDLYTRVDSLEHGFVEHGTFVGSFDCSSLPTTNVAPGSVAIATDAIGMYAVGNQIVRWNGSKWLLADGTGIPATTDPIEFLRHVQFASSDIVRCTDSRVGQLAIVKYMYNGSGLSSMLEKYYVPGSLVAYIRYTEDDNWSHYQLGGRYGPPGLSNVYYVKYMLSVHVRSSAAYQEFYWYAGFSTFKDIASWEDETVGGAVVFKEYYKYPPETAYNEIQAWDNASDTWVTLVDDASVVSVMGNRIRNAPFEERHTVEFATIDGGVNAKIWIDGVVVFDGATGLSADGYKPRNVIGCNVIDHGGHTEIAILPCKEAWYLA